MNKTTTVQSDFLACWNKNRVIEIALEAAKIALHYYTAPQTRLKADGSLVTQADHDIETLLGSHFNHPERDCFLLGEETAHHMTTDYFSTALTEHLYIVDPIDGTISYAHRLPFWGISIGYAYRGEIIEGAAYLPILQEFFISSGDQVFWAEAVTPETNPAAINWRAITSAASAGDYDEKGLIAITQELIKRGTLTLRNPIYAQCCSVVPMCYLLARRYLAFYGQLRIWDLAGILPLLYKTGFTTTFTSGAVMGNRIDAATYHLDANDRLRWKTRELCLYSRRFSPDEIFSRVSFS